MPSATEVFRALDSSLRQHDGEAYPLATALALQLRLAHQTENALSQLARQIELPAALTGTYQLLPGQRPFSSTGEVLFVQSASGETYAVKLLRKLDAAHHFLPNPDQTYAFDLPAVRLMTAVGEMLMGRSANPSQMTYCGVAVLPPWQGTHLELQPLSLATVLAEEGEPVVVMRAMERSLADDLLDLAEGNVTPGLPDRAQLQQWTSQVVQNVLQASVPLPPDLAAEIGAPAEVARLLTGKTIGWLVSRAAEPEVRAQPALAQAVAQAAAVQALFRQFFARPETEAQLLTRAVPWLGDGADARLAQTFSPGDTKFANIMRRQTADGQIEIALLDPQWLVLRPGAIGNAAYQFAPWPFADTLQIAAYTAAQPLAYGFPELTEQVLTEVRHYYGPQHWSAWHQLYFRLLTAYKLLVDVAYNLDPYLDCHKQRQPVPRSVEWIVQRHPGAALKLAEAALAAYDQE